MNQELRIKALPFAFLFRAFESGLHEVALALAQDFFANLFPIRKVRCIDTVSHEWEHEGDDDSDACEPDDESDETENHRSRSINH